MSTAQRFIMYIGLGLIGGTLAIIGKALGVDDFVSGLLIGGGAAFANMAIERSAP